MTLEGTLLRNFGYGFRLGLFLPVRQSAYRTSPGEAAAMLLAVLALGVALSWGLSDSGSTFNFAGLSSVAAAGFLYLAATFLICAVQGRQGSFPTFLILVLSVYPLFAIPSIPFAIPQSRDWLATHIWVWVVVFVAYLVWYAAVVFRSIRLLYRPRWYRCAGLTGLYCLVLLSGQYGLPQQPLFGDSASASPLQSLGGLARSSDSGDTDKWAPYRRLNVERIYYAQNRLLAAALNDLAPQRSDRSDLYFLGFGSYAYQDVFRNEVTEARALFDKRFGTEKRSLALINSLKTYRDVPLANTYNLQQSLNELGRIIDRDQDMVFLYLTSHGSKDHRLSVEFGSLRPRDLSAKHLKKMLDRSGIKWRVIVVSACFSGGFLDVLKDDYSLIMTAARRDRMSFGCSDDRSFTYFGEALINQELRFERSFVKAFQSAVERIELWEYREGLDRSQPQLHVGVAIKDKLEDLERLLESEDRAQTSRAIPGERSATSQ